MKFCSQCGKEIDASARFCPACGNALDDSFYSGITPQTTNYVNPSTAPKTSLAGNTIKGIGIALTIIGLICGIIAIAFFSDHGSIFGYGSWDYYYGGGKELGIGIAVFAGVSLLIGVCMLIGLRAVNSNKQQNK